MDGVTDGVRWKIKVVAWDTVQAATLSSSADLFTRKGRVRSCLAVSLSKSAGCACGSNFFKYTLRSEVNIKVY
jgi:hypothetical protein